MRFLFNTLSTVTYLQLANNNATNQLLVSFLLQVCILFAHVLAIAQCFFLHPAKYLN